MNAYDFIALDSRGKRHKGTIMSSSPRDARDILRSRQLVTIKITHSKPKDQSVSNFIRPRIKHKNLTQATRQLSILIDAATPVEEALKITALQFKNNIVKTILLSVRSQVMEGLRLSDALKIHPTSFSELYIAMVASGETSGRLASVLSRLADDLERAQKIKQKVRGATAYPIVLSVVALTIVVVLMVSVVPKVVQQFDSFGQDLPTLTTLVIVLSEWMQQWGLILLIFMCACFLLLSRLLKQVSFRLSWDKMLLALPIISKIIKDMNAARFSRTMSGLVDSGTPILTALEVSSHTLQNSIMKKAVLDAALKVSEGLTINNALHDANVFPQIVIQMIAGGEVSGDLSRMLAKSAEYLEDEFSSSTDVFLSLLEPLIIILLAGVILLIIGAIFMPILQLNTLIV
ncbi:MAG: type II secretion system inner membrane protein GspF [Hellea sp.]|nr:type II secretion system inner membrane protein GspF [Hellea sp.]